jgi:cytidine deaminase
MTRIIRARLLRAARAAARHSYSPFSKFPVGAAVLADNGRIYSGTNVENSSYGLSMCAERVAVFKAVSSGARRILAVAVLAPSGQSAICNLKSEMPSLTPPCGACLQVINEFGENPEVILSDGKATETCRLRDLLPRGFRL